MAAPRDGASSSEEIAPVGYNAGMRRRPFELAQGKAEKYLVTFLRD
jgi:hypothetical protein